MLKGYVRVAGALLVLALLAPPAGTVMAEEGSGPLEDFVSVGVLTQRGGNLAGTQGFASYSGLAVQVWPDDKNAIQGGMAVQTEGDQDISFHAEYQRHFRFQPEDLHSLFIGGGAFYEDARDSDDDDHIALYSPFGLRMQLENYPVAFTFSSSVRAVVDPDSSFEAFDEVRIGVFYNF